jgi:hypothetical protein
MRSQHSLKICMIFVFLFLSLSLGWAKDEQKTTSPKDSVAKTETPPKGEVGKSNSSASDTLDLFTKAMNDFHEVLAPVWHETYPKKDFKSIREQAPLFQKKFFVLARAPLPNNLEKEKLDSLLAKRQMLSFYVSQFGMAAADAEDSALASTLEQMHGAYEELVGVFAVEIKELDSFHETLYFIWHDALPKKNYSAIKETVPVLKTEIDSLMKVSLPYGCQKDKEEFEKKRTALKDAVYQVALVCQKGTNQQIEEALDLMHERFMELNMLLR